MSAPATQPQQQTANGTNQQQGSSKPRGGNSRSNTPVDANRGGSSDGDANYQGKQRSYGNPNYKKKWHERNAAENANQQAQGQGQGQGGQGDRRKGKDRVPAGEGGNDPNAANGDKKYEPRDKRPDDFRPRRGGGRRGDKDFNQPQAPQEVQPAQQQQPPQPRPPQVDQARIEESRRINALIGTPEHEITHEQQEAIKAVGRVVEGISEADIYDALQQTNWDQNKAVTILVDGSAANSWSDVVRKQRKEQAAPQPQPDRRQQPERSARPGRERPPRANGQPQQAQQQVQQQAPQQQQNPHPQQQQQNPHPQQQQQHPQHQQQQQHQQQLQQQQQQQQLQQQHYLQQQQHYQQQQYYQQQQQLQQQQLQQQQQQQLQQLPLQTYSPLDGEALIMTMSKAIESQLEEIAKKSKLLIEMQNELESIHAAGKDQLTSLHDEKSQLISEQERLQAQLKVVSERLVVVDVAIEKAEQEKFYKLQDWQKKSATHGLIAHSSR